MLYPQRSLSRQWIDLSGVWDFQPDPEGSGERSGWPDGLPAARIIAVPASWNEQHNDLRDYLGDAWYHTRFDLPWGWTDRPVFLRFGSVNYLADVWLNGASLGRHEGGYLPFEFDVTPHLRPEGNRLVVRVNGDLSPDRLPPGNLGTGTLDTFGNIEFPAANFDFFPYCGIHRPVMLYTVPPVYIADLTVTTTIEGADGRVRVLAQCAGESGSAPADGLLLRISLGGHNARLSAEAPVHSGQAEASLDVPGAVFWSPEQPHLYDLAAELVQGGAVTDRYTLPVGIRTIAVSGDQLLLNGQPVTLRGFGRHEDFPALGRGVVPAVTVKDLELLRWTGANSFRTSHYPYAEETLMLADQLGLMVIAETPAVGMFFDERGLEKRMALWREQVAGLIARDKNHPSVIMWSLANEPHNHRETARQSFEDIFALARTLDATRPLTYTTHIGADDPAAGLCDVICTNRYRGWYSESGQLDAGLRALADDLEALHRRFQRPVIVTEFGADAAAGHHAEPPEMFSEEYQAALIMAYHDLLARMPYVVGEHVWVLCDFKTSQSVRRMGALNLKGVFTRDRRPKLAAHRLRQAWAGGG